jgi:hypothetical protein
VKLLSSESQDRHLTRPEQCGPKNSNSQGTSRERQPSGAESEGAQLPLEHRATLCLGEHDLRLHLLGHPRRELQVVLPGTVPHEPGQLVLRAVDRGLVVLVIVQEDEAELEAVDADVARVLLRLQLRGGPSRPR